MNAESRSQIQPDIQYPADQKKSPKSRSIGNRLGIGTAVTLVFAGSLVLSGCKEGGQRGEDGGDMGVGNSGGIVPGANNQDCWKRTGLYRSDAGKEKTIDTKTCGVSKENAQCDPTAYLVVGDGSVDPNARLVRCTDKVERTWG